MGWAQRHNHRMWLSAWTAGWWSRLRALRSVLRSRSVRSWLRGPLWAWLTVQQPKAVEQARLRAIAGRIRNRAHLEELLALVDDPGQREALRRGLRAFLRF